MTLSKNDTVNLNRIFFCTLIVRKGFNFRYLIFISWGHYLSRNIASLQVKPSIDDRTRIFILYFHMGVGRVLALCFVFLCGGSLIPLF